MLNYFTFICVTANGCCSTSAGIGQLRRAPPRPARRWSGVWSLETIGERPRAPRGAVAPNPKREGEAVYRR